MDYKGIVLLTIPTSKLGASRPSAWGLGLVQGVARLPALRVWSFRALACQKKTKPNAGLSRTTAPTLIRKKQRGLNPASRQEFTSSVQENQ